MKGTYWISGKQATGAIIVENSIIVDGAPIFKKFIGQSFWKLAYWLKGDVQWKRLRKPK